METVTKRALEEIYAALEAIGKCTSQSMLVVERAGWLRDYERHVDALGKLLHEVEQEHLATATNYTTGMTGSSGEQPDVVFKGGGFVSFSTSTSREQALLAVLRKVDALTLAAGYTMTISAAVAGISELTKAALRPGYAHGRVNERASQAVEYLTAPFPPRRVYVRPVTANLAIEVLRSRYDIAWNALVTIAEGADDPAALAWATMQKMGGGTL